MNRNTIIAILAAIAIVLAALALYFSLHHSGGHGFDHGCCGGCCGGGANGGTAANSNRFGTTPTTVIAGPTNFSTGNYFQISRTANAGNTNPVEIIFYSNVSAIQFIIIDQSTGAKTIVNPGVRTVIPPGTTNQTLRGAFVVGATGGVGGSQPSFNQMSFYPASADVLYNGMFSTSTNSDNAIIFIADYGYLQYP